MATKVGSMQAKSKSETSQNRPKRQAKYSSMKTLRRQEAKLDVTTVTLNESENEENTSVVVGSESSFNKSLIRKTSQIFNKLFNTPNTNVSASHQDNSSHRKTTLNRKRSFVIETSTPRMPRSITVAGPVMTSTPSLSTPPLIQRSVSEVQNLESSRPHSSSLTTLNSNDTVDSHVTTNSKANLTISTVSDQKYFTIDARRLKKQKNQSDEKLLHGVKQFNLDPKRGLDFLSKSGYLNRDSPKEVADFLFREGRLKKNQIGAVLGGHKDFNKQVLSEYVGLHEFTHLILVTALRQFLWSFRLPGEAMQIDRIMEAFAKHYCHQNPNLFDETDTCYILSFSIIMLNTTLHNPNVKKKISMEQFVSQNRGINSGKDLPKDILELIYKNIKEEPFKIPDESYDDLMYTFFSPEWEGWLLKQGGSWKNWKRRYFVLNDKCLYYFKHTAENIPTGIIPLDNVKVRLMEDMDGKRFLFEVYSDTNTHIKGCKKNYTGEVVQGRHKTYRMSANCEEDRTAWVRSIQESIRKDPFYDIISAKKAALRRKSLRHIDHDIPLNSVCNSVSESTTSYSTNAEVE